MTPSAPFPPYLSFEPAFSPAMRGDFGRFKDYLHLPEAASLAAGLPDAAGDLPVLRGIFDSTWVDISSSLPDTVGFEAAPVDNAWAITFSVEAGTSLLCWVANAADPILWDILDQWNTAKTMLLASHHDDGRSVLWSRTFEIPEWLEAFREHVSDASENTADFVSSMESWGRSGHMKSFAMAFVGAPKRTNPFLIQVRVVHTAVTPWLAYATKLSRSCSSSVRG